MAVQHLAIFFQGHHAGVKIGIFWAPGPCAGHRDLHNVIAGQLPDQNVSCRILDLHMVGTAFLMLSGDLQADGFRGRSGDVDIGNEAPVPHIQPDLPVQAAIGQIIDHKAEGRHRRILGGVQFYRHQILTGLHRIGNLHPKCGIAAAVVGKLPAIDIDRGNMGRTVKLQEQPFALHVIRHFQLPAVSADHLVAFVVGIMQGELLYRVGQPHLLKCIHPV